MKPIHEIINKIKWGKRENINDYIVGYFDRIENKILEIPLKELKCEIPLHRIRYLKKKNKIVWDREKKIDNI
ncbi:MAG: DUF504 domain-containing protein [Candidatus Aenigmatarchaeota archaeon]